MLTIPDLLFPRTWQFGVKRDALEKNRLAAAWPRCLYQFPKSLDPSVNVRVPLRVSVCVCVSSPAPREETRTSTPFYF